MRTTKTIKNAYKTPNAFTLAEVLITLGIIGVVAAMTIPTLMAKYQKRSNALKWRKGFATLAQAVKLMQEDEVPIPNHSEYSTQDDYEYALATHFSKYLKTGAVCHSRKYVEEGCSPKAYPIYSLDGHLMNSDLGNLGGGASCFSLLSGGLVCFDAEIILMDVNGYSKPNKRGEDIFFALLDTDNYVLRPAKGYKSGWGPADGVRVQIERGDGTCRKEDYGTGCSYYYLHNLP